MVTPELVKAPAPAEATATAAEPVELCGKTSANLSRLVIRHLPCHKPAGHGWMHEYEAL